LHFIFVSEAVTSSIIIKSKTISRWLVCCLVSLTTSYQVIKLSNSLCCV
jgi:hypothetical protein